MKSGVHRARLFGNLRLPASRPLLGFWSWSLRVGELDGVTHRILGREGPIANPSRFRVNNRAPEPTNPADGVSEIVNVELNGLADHSRTATVWPSRLDRPARGLERVRNG